MKKLASNKSGQFVIIAVLLIAIMIISMGALMHGAVTYYKHEPWEEYSTLIGDIELNSRRLLELSLADFTNGASNLILSNNLNKWQDNLTKIYPSTGVTLTYDLASGSKSVGGQSIVYGNGLHSFWGGSTGTSSAMSDFTLGVDAIGLSGYHLTLTAILKLKILDCSSINATTSQALAIIQKEDDLPVTSLQKSNFEVSGTDPKRVYSYYDENEETLVYGIVYEGSDLHPIISVWDERGIKVAAQK